VSLPYVFSVGTLSALLVKWGSFTNDTLTSSPLTDSLLSSKRAGSDSGLPSRTESVQKHYQIDADLFAMHVKAGVSAGFSQPSRI
jgi:hypothetical protein